MTKETTTLKRRSLSFFVDYGPRSKQRKNSERGTRSTEQAKKGWRSIHLRCGICLQKKRHKKEVEYNAGVTRGYDTGFSVVYHSFIMRCRGEAHVTQSLQFLKAKTVIVRNTSYGPGRHNSILVYDLVYLGETKQYWIRMYSFNLYIKI